MVNINTLKKEIRTVITENVNKETATEFEETYIDCFEEGVREDAENASVASLYDQISTNQAEEDGDMYDATRFALGYLQETYSRDEEVEGID